MPHSGVNPTRRGVFRLRLSNNWGKWSDMPAAKKRKSRRIPTREDGYYDSISFSVPPDLEILINKRSSDLGFNRSEYIRRLVEYDMYTSKIVGEGALAKDAPPRIRRGRGLTSR